MADHATLLSDIETFIAAQGLTDSQFGRRAVNDWKFMQRLRTARPILTTTEKRVRDFMLSYDPSAYAERGRPRREAEATVPA